MMMVLMLFVASIIAGTNYPTEAIRITKQRKDGRKIIKETTIERSTTITDIS